MDNESQPFERQKVTVGCIIAVIVGLNVWYDYYHPLGLIFDAIILIVLAVRWTRKA